MRTRPDPVEVRSRFPDDHWATGFEVAEVVRQGGGERYRIRRRSDGAVLPVLFRPEEVRREHPARS